ncbi:MAG: DUF177 domain-containing protein [Candidatus Omnitrophica bacterium]|nr:DUF177 domain-containing protein [Candidatus Omnitrophota bacterium]
MKLILSEFEEGISIPVEGSYDAKTIEVEFPDMLYTEPILLTGEAEKSGGMLRLQGTLSTAVKRVCGKCLKEQSENLSFEVDWIFDLSGLEAVEPLENVRELLIVEHPLVHLCKENCRGLCPQCGVDRNEVTCNCKENGYHASPVIIKKEKSKKEQPHGTS